MIQAVFPQDRVERNGAGLRRFLQRRLRIANVRRVLERFETLEIVGGDDDGDGLAMTLDDDPFSSVLGAPQEVGEVVLGVGDCGVISALERRLLRWKPEHADIAFER